MVKIRLRRTGAKKQPSYRVVVTDSRSPRDGKFIEIIGHYNPRTEPPTMEVDAERALYWLSVGAQPSEAVKRMLDKMGILAQVPAVRKGKKSLDEILEELELAKAAEAALKAEAEEEAVEEEAPEEEAPEEEAPEEEAEEEAPEDEEAEEGSEDSADDEETEPADAEEPPEDEAEEAETSDEEDAEAEPEEVEETVEPEGEEAEDVAEDQPAEDEE